MFSVFLLVTTIAVTTLTLVWCFRLWQTQRWLHRERSNVRFAKQITTPVYLIIPLLDEVGRIESTVEYFSRTFPSPQVHFVLVTTERERDFYPFGSPHDTQAAAQRLAERYPQVIALHAPHRQGWMAHQLNVAYRWIAEHEASTDTLIGVYNADSRPEPQTLDWIFRTRRHHPVFQAFQQYGNYTRNLPILRQQPNGLVVEAAAWWQTRWSIGFEVPNALRQETAARGHYRTLPMTYAIGHGLFLSLPTLRLLGGFHEDSRNEDAILGLTLSDLHIPLIPIPFFDSVDAADHVRGWVTQQTNWYFGPAEAWSYPALIRQRHPHRPDWQLFILTFELFLHAMYWIIGPTWLCISLLAALFTGPIPLLLVAALWLLYLMLPTWLSWSVIQRAHASRGLGVQRPRFGALLIGSIPMYLLHGFAGYRALVLMFRARILRHAISKPKTPMRTPLTPEDLGPTTPTRLKG